MLLRATIAGTWNAEPVSSVEQVQLSASLDEAGLGIHIDAAFHGDPAPDVVAGRCPRLWEHEVVELFLASGPEHYLEIELGPYGHYLVLELRGTRNVVRDDFEIEYVTTRRGGRWSGSARLDRSVLPQPIVRWNAFAIHGQAPVRRYLAASPLPGPEPDFHQVHEFPKWENRN